MKRTDFKVVFALMALTALAFSIVFNMKKISTSHTKAEAVVEEECIENEIDPWDLFVEAVIWRESRGNTNAIGDSGKAVGVLQIHPIMVREANRIIALKGGDRETYAYDDRYDREKSIEIFKIVQDYHNKEHDLLKALDIWNKNHPDSYRNEIMNKYNDYLNGEETTNSALTRSI